MKEENKKEKGSPNYTLYCVFFPEKIFSFFHITANLVKSMNYRLYCPFAVPPIPICRCQQH